MKKWKQEIREAFTAPPPMRKEAFLAEHLRYETSLLEFIRIQGGYVAKSTWFLLAALFFLALRGSGAVVLAGREDAVWTASAFLPFWCCLGAKEFSRSRRYGMAEFELSSPHSLAEVTLARLLFVGGAEAALAVALGAFLVLKRGAGILESGLYLLTPYLLTSFLSLLLVRFCRRENELWCCLLAAVFTSVLVIVGGAFFPEIYGESRLALWAGALAILILGNIRELKKWDRQKEEILWSLD